MLVPTLGAVRVLTQPLFYAIGAKIMATRDHDVGQQSRAKADAALHLLLDRTF